MNSNTFTSTQIGIGRKRNSGSKKKLPLLPSFFSHSNSLDFLIDCSRVAIMPHVHTSGLNSVSNEFMLAMKKTKSLAKVCNTAFLLL